MRIVFAFLLIICLICKEKNTQNIIFTPRNHDLLKKMKSIGCECLYNEVKNKFFYNRNTGLYFIAIGADVMYYDKETYRDCIQNKLTLNDIEKLYGMPHLEDDNNMYYYGNVMSCGQRFYGLRFEKNKTQDSIVNIKPHVQEYAFPNDSTFNLRCRSADFLDKEKMRVNQEFFEYFSEEFVDRYFEVASYIKIQPKFEHPQASPRCLENIRFEQNNLLYNSNMRCYLDNYSVNDRAFPLMGYQDEEHKICISFLNEPERIIAAYGEPSYISPNKDTIVYITDNKLYKRKVLNESYVFYEDYDTYGKSSVRLNSKYLPMTNPKNCITIP